MSAPVVDQAVLSVINGFEYFTQDPTLYNRVQKEKGMNPATWNSIAKMIEEQGGTSEQIMSLLKYAVTVVPQPNSPRYPEGFKQEYGIMWIKVAAQLRSQPDAQATLAAWKNQPRFKRNAYFYSSWAYFEKSKRRYADALNVLELGMSLNAEPDHLLPPIKTSILSLQEASAQQKAANNSSGSGTPQSTPVSKPNPVPMVNKENVNTINQKTPSESGKTIGKVPLGPSSTAARGAASKLSSRKPLGIVSKTGGRAERVVRDPELDNHKLLTPQAPSSQMHHRVGRSTDSKLHPTRAHSDGSMVVEDPVVETPYKSSSFSIDRGSASLITPDTSLSSASSTFSVSPFATGTINGSQNRTESFSDNTPTPMQVETDFNVLEPHQQTPPTTKQQPQVPLISETPQRTGISRSQNPEPDRAASPLAPLQTPQSEQEAITKQPSLPQQQPTQPTEVRSPTMRTQSISESKRQVIMHSLQEWTKKMVENTLMTSYTPRMRVGKHTLPPAKPLPKEDEPLKFYTLQVPDWPAAAIVVNSRPFVKLTRVGKGGSSIVYKTMSEDGSIYAIKRVKMFDVDPATRDTYLEEIKLLERLQKYDAVIRLVDYELNTHNQGKEYLYIVLEYAEIDMANILARHKSGLYPDNLNLIRLFWQQMLEALACVHSDEERIVHGDIKPQNFVMVKGHLKLIDFGIAKAINKNTTNIQRENLVGTLNYLAPETLSIMNQASSKYGRPSDVWALGCILFQMVYGKPPFQFQGLQTVQALQCLADPKYRIPFPNSEQLPPDLLHVMSICLTRDPVKRPTTIQLLTHPFLFPERYSY